MHARLVCRSRKNGGQRSSAEAPPQIQTSDCRRVNYPPGPGAGGMESEKSGGRRGRGERLFPGLFSVPAVTRSALIVGLAVSARLGSARAVL